jgi:FAD/FMN-containing dehydrogenase/Fe-S oxidoreductase
MDFTSLQSRLSGQLHYDSLMRTLYATDASVYRELPAAVAIPETEEDIRQILLFCKKHSLPLIPRAAGTSLAGQCVGNGLVVDISRHFTKILEVNAEEGWVRVQPGVIRDELNRFLKPRGLFFGPNTSTANRCMMGGMLGNNSSGSTSIKYGVTRDKVLEVKGFLSDGSPVHFRPLREEELAEKGRQEDLEGSIYRHILKALGDEKVVQEIREQYPKAEIHRRNTGYALDVLLDMQPFSPEGPLFNLSKLIAGSEGTLALVTEIKFQLDPLPPQHEVLLCPHFSSVDESLRAVGWVMEEEPYACELMDKVILDCTKGNRAQEKNRFFVQGDPEAILMIELRAEQEGEEYQQARRISERLQKAGLGYAYPVVSPPRTSAAWDLRKAGLGLLSNVEGDARPVACIEDTAVALSDLPAYIRDFSAMMASYDQRAVYYAHAGAGELHLRPILNLKTAEGVQLFHDITRSTAELVKRYGGSLSGEHGDGRVRAAFIPLMYGDLIYNLFLALKTQWDPDHLLNPGKITEAPPMTENLRYEPDQPEPELETLMDFSDTGGLLGLAEKCNGSGDCRKLPAAGGAMCPSYHATRDEKDTTRARANALREFLTYGSKDNPFNHPELKEVLDLCLSCKACSHECPSSVDMSRMKAEFLHQYQQKNGVPFRSRAFASIGQINRIASRTPAISNFFLKNYFTSLFLKKILGVAPKRSLPAVHGSLLSWYRKYLPVAPQKEPKGRVYFFFDEFTRFQDVEAGKAAIQLLFHLGYRVEYLPHADSGRAQLSKGLLKEAQKLARENVRAFAGKLSEESPLVGVEPSAILSFRDEYPRLVEARDRQKARELGRHTLMIDEFIAREIRKGKISPEDFTSEPARVLLHGHCHQKALSEVSETAWMLSLPENYEVEVIPSGCCGMAGSFGYEKEHFEISMKIGEQVLFPAVRKAETEVIIVAPGTSCRHQILDGTGRKALHPVEVLWAALKK